MKLLVDGEEVEFKDNIQLIEENQIIGCNCNGGTHTEEMGQLQIYIDKEGIQVNIIDSNDETKQCCDMSLDDLFTEMDKIIVTIQHKDEIFHVKNLFHAI